ncbi:MAG: ATP-binding cassette domain-containing protein [Bdellovibrionales bacterium]|nr:ATP-binding cassette domain-containing protein [Bdellovibrionales bacterium]
MIRIRNVTKRFGEQLVLDGINLDIEEGKTTAIVGPSGTGKSVLIKIITGLLLADGGEVLIGKDSMTAAKNVQERLDICARMGVLFQAAALFDSMTLFDNAAFPLRYRKQLGEKEIVARTAKRLKDVGMLDYADRLPGQVSIGMRKRVGIARALVTDPDILLFDEPNTGLDPQVGQEIYELIAATQQHLGFTGIVISHEIPEVFQVCERVAMLYKGKVVIDAEVEEFQKSNNPIVQQFTRGDIEGPIKVG